jgi:hypothetical protein
LALEKLHDDLITSLDDMLTEGASAMGALAVVSRQQ